MRWSESAAKRPWQVPFGKHQPAVLVLEFRNSAPPIAIWLITEGYLRRRRNGRDRRPTLAYTFEPEWSDNIRDAL